MIRAKLISPVNLLLEHPLLFADDKEDEFFVIGKKEYEDNRKQWIEWSAFLGGTIGLAVGALIAVLAMVN